jgi:hypothetical protein
MQMMQPPPVPESEPSPFGGLLGLGAQRGMTHLMKRMKGDGADPGALARTPVLSKLFRR